MILAILIALEFNLYNRFTSFNLYNYSEEAIALLDRTVR